MIVLRLTPERSSCRRWARPPLLQAVLLVSAAALAAGCNQQLEPVTAYTIPKPPPPVRPATAASSRVPDAGSSPKSEAEQPGTMLGAILPRGKEVWFFKLLGPKTAVLEQAVPFLQLVKSLEFESGRPKWSLPEGWTERPGNEFRFATLLIDSDFDEPLEVTVSTLPMSGTDLPEYLLSNVNRWRGQLQQPPLKPEELAKQTMAVQVAGEPAWLVNISGTYAGNPMRSGPAPQSSPKPFPEPREARGKPAQDLPFSFDLPEGWSPKAAGAMRLAEFAIADGNRKAVTSVSTAGGDLFANINRWRGQIELDPVSPEELRSALKKIALGPVEGDYVQLFGPGKSKPAEGILGVVATANGRQWFIKLQGDADLVRRETERFEAFVQSIRFRGAEGEKHGN